jgi:predicted transcriptional regulator
MPRGPKPKYSDHLALRVEPDFRRLLEEMAEGEKRTPSQMARILLEEAIEARKAGEMKVPTKPPRKRS